MRLRFNKDQAFVLLLVGLPFIIGIFVTWVFLGYWTELEPVEDKAVRAGTVSEQIELETVGVLATIASIDCDFRRVRERHGTCRTILAFPDGSRRYMEGSWGRIGEAVLIELEGDEQARPIYYQKKEKKSD